MHILCTPKKTLVYLTSVYHQLHVFQRIDSVLRKFAHRLQHTFKLVFVDPDVLHRPLVKSFERIFVQHLPFHTFHKKVDNAFSLKNLCAISFHHHPQEPQTLFVVDLHDFGRDELANGICPELLGDEEVVADSNRSGHRHLFRFLSLSSILLPFFGGGGIIYYYKYYNKYYNTEY